MQEAPKQETRKQQPQQQKKEQADGNQFSNSNKSPAFVPKKNRVPPATEPGFTGSPEEWFDGKTNYFVLTLVGV